MYVFTDCYFCFHCNYLIHSSNKLKIASIIQYQYCVMSHASAVCRADRLSLSLDVVQCSSYRIVYQYVKTYLVFISQKTVYIATAFHQNYIFNS